MKRAAIYVRVSTELQAEKASPQAQEDDAREYCRVKGYEIVEVYRDTEAYRVGSRMVQPSGTRADRPQWRRMLADAEADKFNVIVAWRNDRLSRGMRPMIDLMDVLDRGDIEVELVKDTFDKRTAELLAWAAKIENEARSERSQMGLKARLSAGRGWLARNVYGYAYSPETGITIREDEAQWVRAIWAWFGAGVTVREIRRRLIEAGAKGARESKFTWPVHTIRRYLRNDYYHTGTMTRQMGGETYEMTVPAIVDPETAEQVAARHKQWKKYPAGNQKAQALAGGLAHCAGCGRRLRLQHREDKNGRTYDYYACSQPNYLGERVETCCPSLWVSRVDRAIWEKLWEVVSQPAALQAALQARIAALRAEDAERLADTNRLESQLDEIEIERQKVITWARKSLINESDMESQLLILSFQEAELKRKLSQAHLLAANTDRLAALAEQLQEQLIEGLQGLNATPADDEQEERQLEARKRVLHQLVERITVAPNGTPTLYLYFEIDSPTLEGLYIKDTTPMNTPTSPPTR